MATPKRQVSIFINGRQVENSIKAIRTEKRKLNRELNDMVLGSEKYNMTVKEIKQLDGVISGHRRRIRDTASSYQKIIGGVTKFAGVAGLAFGVSELVQYGRQLLKVGVEMDQLNRKAATVFGQALPAVTAAARENAAAMGLTEARYVGAATALGDLLIPMGFTREEAATQATEMINLAGALSEWTGGQIDATRVSEILTKAMLGEREELKQLGIAISEEDVKNRLREKGLEKLTGQYLQQAKAIATQELILEKSVDAQTSYIENTDDLISRQNRLRASIAEITERLSVALLPIFEKLVGVAQTFADFLGRVTSGLSGTSTQAGRTAQSVSRLQAEFNLEIETLKRSNLTQDARAELLQKINDKYGQYLPNLLDEKSTIDDITAAQDAANKAFQERIILLAAEDRLVQVANERLAAKEAELELQKQLTAAQQASSRAQDVSDAQRGLSINSQDFANNREVRAFSELAQAEAAVEGNIRKQQELEQQFQKTIASAKELGLNIDQALNGGGSDQTGGSTDGGGGTGSKRVDELRNQLQQLADVAAGFREEQRLADLSEDERRLEEIRLRYQKQIDLAAQLEASGVEAATQQRIELEQLQAQALDAARQEITDARLAKDLEREEAEFIAEQERRLQYEERRKELELQISEEALKFALNETEREVMRLEEYYDELLEQAEAFGIDTFEIEFARQKALEQVRKKARQNDLDSEEEYLKKRIKASVEAYRELGNLVSEFSDLFINESGEAAEAGKLLTLIQIGLKSAEALAAATAAGAGLNFPANLGAIASGVAAVLANMNQARRLLSDTPDVPQRKDGGWATVRGENDRRTYRAQRIGTPGSGFLPDHPVLINSVTGTDIVASENGSEYFVSNENLDNPEVFRRVVEIDNIVRQRNEGGFSTEDPRGGSPTLSPEQTGGSETSMVNARLLVAITELNTLLRNGIIARYDDDFIIDLLQRINTLQDASGGVLNP